MEISKIQTKIEKKEKEIEVLKQQLENESNKSEWVKIPTTDYEITKNVLYKGKSYNEIIKLKKPEEELLTLKLIGTICENPALFKMLKMDSSSTEDDFFFKQPFPKNEEEGRVARFYADSDYSDLNCFENSSYSNSNLGVRFVRKISKSKKGK